MGRLTLADSAYETMRSGIIALRLEPGTMVYENELAQSLSMSRTPVREAFRKLAVEDFIEVLPQRGIRISLISQRKVEEARFVRESLEVSAFRLVASRWQSGDPACRAAELMAKDILTNQEQAARMNEPQRFLELDEAFHALILGLAGNETLIGLIGYMRGHLNRIRSLMLRELDHSLDIVEEHERILQALTAADPDRVETAMRGHLAKLTMNYPQVAAMFPHYFKP